jgi:hypothetical protein
MTSLEDEYNRNVRFQSNRALTDEELEAVYTLRMAAAGFLKVLDQAGDTEGSDSDLAVIHIESALMHAVKHATRKAYE